MKLENGGGVKAPTSGAKNVPADDSAFSDNPNTKTTNLTGRAKSLHHTPGRKSIDEKPKSKRHRRSAPKSRMADAFDLLPMRRRTIVFSMGRKADVVVGPRPVGRPKKNKTAPSVVPRPKISVPPSDYRKICARLATYGKKKTSHTGDRKKPSTGIGLDCCM